MSITWYRHIYHHHNNNCRFWYNCWCCFFYFCLSWHLHTCPVPSLCSVSSISVLFQLKHHFDVVRKNPPPPLVIFLLPFTAAAVAIVVFVLSLLLSFSCYWVVSYFFLCLLFILCLRKRLIKEVAVLIFASLFCLLTNHSTCFCSYYNQL